MQSSILLFCGLVALTTHSLPAAGVFFVVMQVSALVGASWALRLKHKLGSGGDTGADLSRAAVHEKRGRQRL